MPIGFDESAPGEPGLGIDLTPMIDVTFLLIIFWLVVTSVAPSEPVRELELPAASVRQAAGAGHPVMIDVTGESVRPIWWLGRAFSLAELDEQLTARPLSGRAVVLRADRRADAALVARLARLCYGRGAESVAFSLQAISPRGGGR